VITPVQPKFNIPCIDMKASDLKRKTLINGMLNFGCIGVISFFVVIFQTPRIMEGKTDSKTSGEMLLQGAEANVDPVDRVSLSLQFVMGECCNVVHDEKRKVRF